MYKKNKQYPEYASLLLKFMKLISLLKPMKISKLWLRHQLVVILKVWTFRATVYIEPTVPGISKFITEVRETDFIVDAIEAVAEILTCHRTQGLNISRNSLNRILLRCMMPYKV